VAFGLEPPYTLVEQGQQPRVAAIVRGPLYPGARVDERCEPVGAVRPGGAELGVGWCLPGGGGGVHADDGAVEPGPVSAGVDEAEPQRVGEVELWELVSSRGGQAGRVGLEGAAETP